LDKSLAYKPLILLDFHRFLNATWTMRYAQKEKKNILNLAEEGYGDKE
jgi:hypothetical protein